MTTSSTLTLIIVALVAGLWLAALVRTILLDGLGQRSSSGLPRSHPPDPFTPHRT